MMWFGGNMVLGGTLQVGNLTGLLSYVLQVMNALMMISNVFLLLTRSLASAHRIVRGAGRASGLLLPGRAVKERCADGSVDFDGRFVQIPRRTRRSMPSPTSSSTIAGGADGRRAGRHRLGQIDAGAAHSQRLYDATQGTVRRWAAAMCVTYDLRALRDAVGIVLQKNVLFSGTVRDNLRWGNTEAGDEELWEACRAACADEFLERMPKGLDTDLGQGGVNVSGGQKQRLCIARTLLKHPKVLIFDDSTSAVDTATGGEDPRCPAPSSPI